MEKRKLKFKNLFLMNLSLIIFLFFLLFSLIPNKSQAAGLVPCGGEGENPCTLCDFFVLLDRVIDFFILPPYGIVFIIAVLMMLVGGIMFYFGGFDPGTLQKAQNLFKNVVIGLIIIYGAWLFINFFFQVIGVNEWTGLKTWWQINCPVSAPPTP
ncbi:MAG: hypothetical protein C0412_17845 [Flavobacterium sp.]|nr:hypothetical protein [Flavobacterium sp.]